MNIENCKCGSSARLYPCYRTRDRMHGYNVVCTTESVMDRHWGPPCKTERGAIRTWNQWQKSGLSIEEISAAFCIGTSLKRAQNIHQNIHARSNSTPAQEPHHADL